MKIAVVEDNRDCASRLERSLKRFQEEYHEPIEIVFFSN